MKFFDRKKEIKLLREIRDKALENAQFTVLTGRRRIGKTSLVLKAYEDDKANGHINIEVGAYSKMREIINRDYDTFSGFMLERYFRAKMIESGNFTRVGGWWDRKGMNEIDIISVDDIEETICFTEIKRNPDRYDPDLLKEKSNAFFQVNKNLNNFTKSYQCLSLRDM